jgi:DNA primase
LGAWCLSGVPTVAAYCADNLAAWQWPAGVQRLLIFADHDKAGSRAADTLLSRAVKAGLQASVLTPTEPGDDWADVWAAHRAAEVSA